MEIDKRTGRERNTCTGDRRFTRSISDSGFDRIFAVSYTHLIEEEDKEAFDAGKDQADRKRRKNVLPEIGPNEEMKKEAEQGKTDKETAQSGNNIEKEAEKLDDKAEGETEKSGYKAGSETEQSDDKVKKEAEKPNDKNEEDAEDEMIKEGGKNQEPELAMEEFIEETETEIENDYEER